MKKHNFHIPVMGIGFTIDTPLKVAHLGIDSVISLVDDELIEKIRKKISTTFALDYVEITDKAKDFRAARITSYLDMVQNLTQKKLKSFQKQLAGNKEQCLDYFTALPGIESIFLDGLTELVTKKNTKEIEKVIKKNSNAGSIDVNIMTKVDKENYVANEKMPTIYNDAHAALRGFANSTLNSSIVLSAGMNPRLYSYIEDFSDFYPDVHGKIKKRVILKVSDFRSAYIQGKFLAKKGIWVSEFRIESGLNCGGHAFATDGHLMGPILAEFRDRKQELETELFALLKASLERKNKTIPENTLGIKLSAQGGVGTAEEHQFLINEYNLNSIGWGTPFLLVPEATTVDKDTLQKLSNAKEDDLYLSDISPLGIPFHNLKGNTKDHEKFKNIKKQRPGSSCPKKFVALNKEFKEKGLCTASREYQYKKIKELEQSELPKEAYQQAFNKIVEKSCTCVGLGTSALLAHGIETKREGEGVSVCPGPNMAYFNQIVSLREMIQHIYGKVNLISNKNRPQIFLKELSIYMDYLRKQLTDETIKNKKSLFSKFIPNLEVGISYYENIKTSLFEGSEKEAHNFYAKIEHIKNSLINYKKSFV